MKVFVITGEPSADKHASKIVSELLKRRPQAIVKGWGGSELRNAGMEIMMDINHLSFMGISNVIGQLPKVIKLFTNCKNQIELFNPDLILLVDFSGFNLRIAKWAKKKGYKVDYYIAPKTWAWRSSRNKYLKKYVDHLYCIFPFEEEYFQTQGIRAIYVGNPSSGIELKNNPTSKTVVILPGSRIQEIRKVLPKLKSIISERSDLKWVVSKMPQISITEYEKQLSGLRDIDVEISEDDSNVLLSKSSVAIVTSGTATLEAAIIGCPQIVIYHTSILNYWVGRLYIKTKFISLPNLILNEAVADELIQNDLNSERLSTALVKLMREDEMNQMKMKYNELKSHLTDKSPELIVADYILQQFN